MKKFLNYSKGKLANFASGFSLKNFVNVIKPNKSVSWQAMSVVVALQVSILMYFWSFSSELLPTPSEVWESFKMLVSGEPEIINGKPVVHKNLGVEMWTSTKLCLVAIVQTVVISLFICYATVLPLFRPIAFIVTKFRFLTLVGLSFVFTVMTAGSDDGGYLLKVSLLTFGMSVFFVTSMMRIIKNTTSNELNHARTLGMNEWRVVWEVIILSKLDKVFEIIRQNFAIAWMMLTIVEGLARADGGVGIMLLNQNKYLALDNLFAIQFLILFVGIGMDYLFGVLKRLLFPYANLTKENKS